MMRRRAFVVGMAAVLAAPLLAEAQQAQIGPWGRGWSSGHKGLGPGVSILLIVHFSAVSEETVMEVRMVGPYDIEYVLDDDDPRK